MSEKRPYIRFHLLTAVLMMLAAGGMFWLNAMESKGFLKHAKHHLPVSVMLPDGTTLEEASLYGWPMPFIERIQSVTSGVDGTAFCANLLVMGTLLAAVALVSESLLRRREGRKP